MVVNSSDREEDLKQLEEIKAVEEAEMEIKSKDQVTEDKEGVDQSLKTLSRI